MDTKTFFENFETIANAPGGIARLRELINDLAVHGKLTKEREPQDLSVKFKVPGITLDIPSHWGVLGFEECFDMKGGGQPPKSTFSESPKDGYIRLYQIRDYGPNPVPVFVPVELAPRTTRQGDILIARYGASGKVFWAEEGAYNVALAKLLFPKDLYIDKFAFLMFQSGEFQRAVRGTTRVAVDGFNKKDLKNVFFPLPPLEEQRRIVAKVDELMALCDKLELAQQQRDSLKRSARNSAIDSISTASTAEELGAAWKRINQNWTTFADTPESISSLRSLVLDLAIQGLLTNSDLSAWSESNLGDVVEIIRGVTFPASAKQRSPMKGLIPCLRTANVQNEVDWDDLLYISEEYVRKESQIVMKDDILISMANSRELVGKVALVKRDDLRCTLGGFIAALRCSEAILPEFLMSILRVPSARDKLIDSSTQTTNIANISIGRLKPFEIRIPPVEVQKRIVAKVDELITLCDELENHLRIRNEAQLQLCRAVTSSVAA